MLVIPAVDIKAGCVVRLVQGAQEEKVYSRSPAKTARHWVKQGARLIHVVDLDGAEAGRIKNLAAVEEIIKNVDVPVEFGGGVRNMETIEQLLALGIARIVLGTRAVEDEEFLKRVFRRFKRKVIVSVDTKAGSLRVKGWSETAAKIKVEDLILRLKEMGFKEFIYTDTLKDGTLKGPNIKEIKALLKMGLPLIASGGISSLADIYRLKLLEKKGLAGLIVGKALYEGRFTLAEAIKIA